MDVARIAVVCLLVWSADCFAGSISSLRSTGYDSAGRAVLSGIDGNYRLARHDFVGPFGAAYDPLNAPAPVTLGTVYDPAVPVPVVSSPHPAWFAGNSQSRWVSWANSSGSSNSSGRLFVYQTTFDLSGYDLSTVEITGRFGTDDFGWAYLNLPDLVSPGASHRIGSHGNFSSFSPFAISGTNPHLRTGRNTLSFYAWDSGGGVTGLRVEVLSATGDRTMIAEPAATWLIGAALLVLSLKSRWSPSVP